MATALRWSARPDYEAHLARLRAAQDHAGIIALWRDFDAFYAVRQRPRPAGWQRWETAAQEATFALRMRAGLLG